jgi:ribosomal protein S18 acetylase RimI-like enzyme
MLVKRSARRRGVGALVLAAAERAAFDAGKSLLVLDTASDDAVRLYERAGWQRVGTVPKYALMPDGPFCSTAIYYKDLSGR